MRRAMFAAIGLLLWVGCGPEATQPPPEQPPPPPPPPPPVQGNHAPVATITGPASAREGEIVTFSAQGSTDADGDSLWYTWRSGYGDDKVISGPNFLEARGRWAYPDNGTYSASVIVSDRNGAADTARTVIVVQNVPPAISLSPPAGQAAGDRASTEFIISDSGMADAHVVTINWGDGTRDSIAEPPLSYRDSLSHVYASIGSYQILASVRDKDGATTTQRADSAVRVYDSHQHRTIAGYDMFDIGTLGGNSARPMDFNDRGQIVGSSTTASGAIHAFLWKNGAMQDLGTAGQNGSEAQRINNAGVIAGAVWTQEDPDCRRNAVPAVWKNGIAEVLSGGQSLYGVASAEAINESGVIAWRVCGHETDRTWRWRDGQWQALAQLEEPWGMSLGQAINERGEIVGANDAVEWGEPTPLKHAFLWESDATVRDLGLLSSKPCEGFPAAQCGFSTALGINESAQIVGFSTAADGSFHAVMWDHGAIDDLWRVTGSGNESGYALINDAGDVAGSAGGEGFFWRNGIAHALGSLGGGRTVVVDMNESGTVVGTSRTTNGEQHVFVWSQNSGMIDLSSGPNGFNGSWVVGISYDGDIVGFTGPCSDYWKPVCWPPNEVRAVLWRRITP